jgi:hypothetical protein
MTVQIPLVVTVRPSSRDLQNGPSPLFIPPSADRRLQVARSFYQAWELQIPDVSFPSRNLTPHYGREVVTEVLTGLDLKRPDHLSSAQIVGYDPREHNEILPIVILC